MVVLFKTGPEMILRLRSLPAAGDPGGLSLTIGCLLRFFAGKVGLGECCGEERLVLVGVAAAGAALGGEACVWK